MLQYNYCATVHYKSEISYIKRIMVTSIVYHAIYSTGSRGDLFVVRTSKPVENLRLSVWEKKSKEREGKGGGEGGRDFFAQDRLTRYSVPLSPFGRRAVRQRGYGLLLLMFKMANNKVDLGQIRSEEMVYSRFTKISWG